MRPRPPTTHLALQLDQEKRWPTFKGAPLSGQPFFEPGCCEGVKACVQACPSLVVTRPLLKRFIWPAAVPRSPCKVASPLSELAGTCLPLLRQVASPGRRPAALFALPARDDAADCCESH